MTHLGIYWQRTALLLMVFICTVLIIYQLDKSDYGSRSSKSEFYEDFGDEVSEKEKLISDNNKEDKSLDQPVEVKKAPAQAQEEIESIIATKGPLQAPEEMEPSIAEDHHPSYPTEPDQENAEGSDNNEDANEPVDKAHEPKDASTNVKPSATMPPQQDSLIEVTQSSSQKQLTSEKIPRIIHQSAASETLPIVYKNLIESCINLNKDWRYYFWRHQDRDQFLLVRYPKYAEWFGKLTSSQQYQLFRFFVLHAYGGIYLDADMECVKPLAPTLANTSLFVGAERPELSKIVRGRDKSADISALAGTPGHKLFNRTLTQLSSLPYDSIDATALLTALFDAFSSESAGGNCTLQDYHYFGSALDASFPWNSTCAEVLHDVQPISSSTSEQDLDSREQGCVELQQHNWNLLDLNSQTVAVRRYLNVSSTVTGGDSFNLTQLFTNRVTYYNEEY